MIGISFQFRLPPSAFAKAPADRRSFSGGWSAGRLWLSQISGSPHAAFRLKAEATSPGTRPALYQSENAVPTFVSAGPNRARREMIPTR